MNLVPARPQDLQAIEGFLAGLGVPFLPSNREQFLLPRRCRGCRVATYLHLDAAGEIAGLIGCLDLPLRSPEETVFRWPINFFLAPHLHGRGVGKAMMSDVTLGAEGGLVLGGNPRSIPVLERTGWEKLGELKTYRWSGARERDNEQIEVLPGLPATAPWTLGLPVSLGVPRTPETLAFAFGGALAPYHAPFQVLFQGSLIGYFVLSARHEDGSPGAALITDFDAVPGFEAATLTAALAHARRLAAEVITHVCARRFCQVLDDLEPTATSLGLPLWIWRGKKSLPATLRAEDWHITHGDHDRYRQWPSSQRWATEDRDRTRFGFA